MQSSRHFTKNSESWVERANMLDPECRLFLKFACEFFLLTLVYWKFPPLKAFFQRNVFTNILFLHFPKFSWYYLGVLNEILRPIYTGDFFCDFRGDFCYNFKCNFRAISNRPWKLLAIQIAMESPEVYTVGNLKSPWNHTWNCRWNRRASWRLQQKSPV